MPRLLSAVQSYGLAVLAVSVALGGALLLERYNFRGVEFPVFLFAIVITVWYARLPAAILALVLAALGFNYFFTESFHTLYVTRSELPYYFAFILFASLLTWFTAVRRRVERELLQSRDELEREVAESFRAAPYALYAHRTISDTSPLLSRVIESEETP